MHSKRTGGNELEGQGGPKAGGRLSVSTVGDRPLRSSDVKAVYLINDRSALSPVRSAHDQALREHLRNEVRWRRGLLDRLVIRLLRIVA